MSKVCPGTGRRFRSMVAEDFVNCPVCKADAETLGLSGLTFRIATGAIVPEHPDCRSDYSVNLTQPKSKSTVTKK